uniref:LIM zinc-binding domain-containing protein n=1 Tax=Heterorhabditis bacteriophora TaxID=37862 RepID=A0A1I7WRP3_HETBA
MSSLTAVCVVYKTRAIAVFAQSSVMAHIRKYLTLPTYYQREPAAQLTMTKQSCYRCTKQVYPTDKVGPLKDSTFFHQGCFKCYICGTRLALKTYCNNRNDINDKEVYCANHVPIAGPHDLPPSRVDQSTIENGSCKASSAYRRKNGNRKERGIKQLSWLTNKRGRCWNFLNKQERKLMKSPIVVITIQPLLHRRYHQHAVKETYTHLRNFSQ